MLDADDLLGLADLAEAPLGVEAVVDAVAVGASCRRRSRRCESSVMMRLNSSKADVRLKLRNGSIVCLNFSA